MNLSKKVNCSICWVPCNGLETPRSVGGLRQRAFQILEHGRRREPASRTIDWIIISLVVANVVATIVQTVPTLAPEHAAMLQLVDRLCVVVFAVEYAARLWAAPEHPLLGRYPAHIARLRFAGRH